MSAALQILVAGFSIIGKSHCCSQMLMPDGGACVLFNLLCYQARIGLLWLMRLHIRAMAGVAARFLFREVGCLFAADGFGICSVWDILISCACVGCVMAFLRESFSSVRINHVK